MAQPNLVLFAGPAAAGKTTLAAAWCETRERAVHIQLDEVRSLIVSGFADPQEGGPVGEQQYRLAVTGCCALARTFLADGYDVAIDDALEPDVFRAEWETLLAGLRYQIVVVLPAVDETLRRSGARKKRVKVAISRQQQEACLAWPAELHLDTTGLDVEASLSLAREKGLLP